MPEHAKTKARILDEMLEIAGESLICGAAFDWLMMKVAERHGIAPPAEWPRVPALRSREVGFRVRRQS